MNVPGVTWKVDSTRELGRFFSVGLNRSQQRKRSDQRTHFNIPSCMPAIREDSLLSRLPPVESGSRFNLFHAAASDKFDGRKPVYFLDRGRCVVFAARFLACGTPSGTYRRSVMLPPPLNHDDQMGGRGIFDGILRSRTQSGTLVGEATMRPYQRLA